MAGNQAPCLRSGQNVTDFMHCHSMPSAVGLAHTCDFSGVSSLLDVGGGSGCYASALANHYPEMKCTIMELAAVCEVAKGYIEKAGVSDRVDTTTVDMFREDWPEGYEAHFFSNIFHDWSIETCEQLAQKSFELWLQEDASVCRKFFWRKVVMNPTPPSPSPFS